MDKKTGNNVRKSFVKCALFFLCLGFCLVTDNFEVRGARVTGENGVIPVAPESEKKSRRPAKVKSPQSTPSYKMPARRNKALKRKTSDKYQGLAENASNQDERYVTINFDNVAINIFIRFISELTGKNFVIDKAIRGKVTIISPTKITVDEAYKVFESVLEVNGYTTVPAGSIIKIVPSVSARSKDIETRLKREISIRQDTLVTQLVPLKYADPDRLKKL
ncbi:MAG: hypothetical protein JRJ86_19080, partial [Deltaproteobacteria bacterium]|nr:hypothetical protein [Deltaproteobacteria bacterium]